MFAGTCSFAASASLDYNQCAMAGGVALGPNNMIGALTKGQFEYTPGSCSYQSVYAHLVSKPDFYCPEICLMAKVVAHLHNSLYFSAVCVLVLRSAGRSLLRLSSDADE